MEAGLVFPVVPGKREALVAFAQSLMNERRSEYEASQVSIHKESWFLQPTPMGDVCVVHFEAADPAAVFQGLAESEEPFDVWFRSQVLETTGVDLSKSVGAIPERIFNWSRE